MNHPLLKIVYVATLVVTTACGLEPSGEEKKSTSTASAEIPADKKTPTQPTDKKARESADALPSGIAKLPEEFNAINTSDVSACHATGKVYNRRTLKCSKSIALATAFECTKIGITEGFISTGYQIDAVLIAAEEDGFVIDQCGQTDDGLRLVFFVRADADGTFSIREIETSIN
jgi:hypothetical protein